MGDTVKKTAKYWHELYHETLLLFPDELRVMKGAVMKEMEWTNHELFKVVTSWRQISVKILI